MGGSIVIKIEDRFNPDGYKFIDQEYQLLPDPMYRKDRVHVYLAVDGIVVTMTPQSLEKAFPAEVEKREKLEFIRKVWECIHQNYDEVSLDEDCLWEHVQKLRGKK